MRRVLFALVAVLSFALAQGARSDYTGLVLSTPFPSTTVRAGETVNLSLKLKSYNLEPQYVRLGVEGVPEGWTVALLGDGRPVKAAYLEPDGSVDLSLRVEIPKDAAAKAYTMTLVASGSTAKATLPLTFTLGEVLPPKVSLEVELPVLKGTPTSTFRFRATLKNESDQDLLVGLNADAPQGFEVRFKPAFSTQEVTTLPLKAGASKDMDIEISPPPQVAAGTYPIQVLARAGEASASLSLKVVITGRPELSLSTPDGRLSGKAYAGRFSPLKLVIKNRGSAPAKNVKLSSFEPSGWEVKFDPKKIDEIPAGGQTQVTVQIKPSQKAIAGDYMVTLTANPQNGTSKSEDFRITVLTSTLWGIVGIVLIAVALGALAFAVARFGRR